MEALGVEDSRLNSTNKFKKIIGAYPRQTTIKREASHSNLPTPTQTPTPTPSQTPTPTASDNNEISLDFESRPQDGIQTIGLKLARPRIFVVPNHLLAIIVSYHLWLLLASTNSWRIRKCSSH